MNHCFICKSPHTTNEELFVHIRSHIITKNYRCAESNCIRLFDNLKSFKRHRRRDHPDTCESTATYTYDDNANPWYANDNGCIENDGDELIKSVENDVSESEVEDNSETFENLLFSDALKFVTFLYSLSDLPRNRVQKIVEIFTKFLNGAALSRLENMIFKTLKNSNMEKNEMLQLKLMLLSLIHI